MPRIFQFARGHVAGVVHLEENGRKVARLAHHVELFLLVDRLPLVESEYFGLFHILAGAMPLRFDEILHVRLVRWLLERFQVVGQIGGVDAVGKAILHGRSGDLVAGNVVVRARKGQEYLRIGVQRGRQIVDDVRGGSRRCVRVQLVVFVEAPHQVEEMYENVPQKGETR